MEELQQKVNKWAEEAVEAYLRIVDEDDWDYEFYTQSPLDHLTKRPEYFIIEFNPYGDAKCRKGTDEEETRKMFLKDNPCLKGNPCWKQYKDFSNIKKLMKWLPQVNGQTLLDDDSNFILTNASFFNTLKAKDLPDKIWKKTLPLTLQLAEIVQPKRILILSAPIHKYLKAEHIVDKETSCPILCHGQIHGIDTISTYHPNARLRTDVRMQIINLIGSFVE